MSERFGPGVSESDSDKIEQLLADEDLTEEDLARATRLEKKTGGKFTPGKKALEGLKSLRPLP